MASGISPTGLARSRQARHHGCMAAVEVSRRTKLLILLAFVPVFGLFIWGALRAPIDSTAARKGCLEPYFAAIDAGRYDEAYARHTTEAYRARFSADAFRGAMERRLRERGTLVAREDLLLNGFAELAGPVGFYAQAWFRYEHGPSAHVQYRLVRGKDGTYRIDWSSEQTAGRSTLTPAPF